jgi:hypothetical protein
MPTVKQIKDNYSWKNIFSRFVDVEREDDYYDASSIYNIKTNNRILLASFKFEAQTTSGLRTYF